MAKAAGKATKGGLTPEQSERVRKAIRERLLPRFEGNGAALARALGAQQSGIYRFLHRGAGTSIQVAAKVAELLNEDLSELIGLARPPAGRIIETDDDQPYRPEAIAVLQRMGMPPSVVEQLRDHPGARDGKPMSLRFWIELGQLYDRQGARTGTPLGGEDDTAPIARAAKKSKK